MFEILLKTDYLAEQSKKAQKQLEIDDKKISDIKNIILEKGEVFTTSPLVIFVENKEKVDELMGVLCNLTPLITLRRGEDFIIDYDTTFICKLCLISKKDEVILQMYHKLLQPDYFVEWNSILENASYPSKKIESHEKIDNKIKKMRKILIDYIADSDFVLLNDLHLIDEDPIIELAQCCYHKIPSDIFKDFGPLFHVENKIPDDQTKRTLYFLKKAGKRIPIFSVYTMNLIPVETIEYNYLNIKVPAPATRLYFAHLSQILNSLTMQIGKLPKIDMAVVPKYIGFIDYEKKTINKYNKEFCPYSSSSASSPSEES